MNRVGLTLLEVLAVTVLLGLVASLILNGWKPHAVSPSPQAQLQQADRMLRILAREHGGLTLSLEQGTWQVQTGDGRSTPLHAADLPPGTWLTLDGTPLTSLVYDLHGFTSDAQVIIAQPNAADCRAYTLRGITGALLPGP